MEEQRIKKMFRLANRMRKNDRTTALAAGNDGAHLGADVSVIEILATL
jgi:transketolase N-terminal domain/subunit